MHKKTKALLRDFKRAIEATPNKPTSVIAKELGVSAQTLYQIKHTHMKSERRTIEKKAYGLTKTHAVAEGGFINPTVTRNLREDALRAEHDALTKDYVELHDKHLALIKKYEEAGLLALKFQKEALDMQAIVKYLEGKVGA